jgi:hypothetical protein
VNDYLLSLGIKMVTMMSGLVAGYVLITAFTMITQSASDGQATGKKSLLSIVMGCIVVALAGTIVGAFGLGYDNTSDLAAELTKIITFFRSVLYMALIQRSPVLLLHNEAIPDQRPLPTLHDPLLGRRDYAQLANPSPHGHSSFLQTSLSPHSGHIFRRRHPKYGPSLISFPVSNGNLGLLPVLPLLNNRDEGWWESLFQG